MQVNFLVEILEEEELWCTETGQLSTSLKGESLFSLNKAVVVDQLEKLQTSRLNSDEHVAGIVDAAKNLSGFEYPENFGKAIFSGRYVEKEYMLEKYLIPGSGDYMLPAALFRPIQNRKKELILYLDAMGMDQAIKSNQLVHSLVQQGNSVLLFDVRGIGSLGPGYLKGDAYIDNTSFNQWFAGILTNKSIVGLRAEDIIRLVHFAASDLKEVETISALTIGAMGSEMLHAAAFDGRIGKLCMIQPFISYADIALSHHYSAVFIPSTVAGAIDKYDLLDLMASFCPRELLIINPQKSDGNLVEKVETDGLFAYPKRVYHQKRSDQKFMYFVDNDTPVKSEQVIQWFD